MSVNGTLRRITMRMQRSTRSRLSTSARLALVLALVLIPLISVLAQQGSRPASPSKPANAAALDPEQDRIASLVDEPLTLQPNPTNRQLEPGEIWTVAFSP